MGELTTASCKRAAFPPPLCTKCTFANPPPPFHNCYSTPPTPIRSTICSTSGAVHEGARARLRGGQHHDGHADPPIGTRGRHPSILDGAGGDRHLLRDPLQPHEGPGRPRPRAHDLARELLVFVGRRKFVVLVSINTVLFRWEALLPPSARSCP